MPGNAPPFPPGNPMPPGNPNPGPQPPPGQAPVAVDDVGDAFTTNEDSLQPAGGFLFSTSLLDNDSDPNGDLFTVTAINGDTAIVGTQIEVTSDGLRKATLTVDSSGNVTLFDPDGNFDSLAEGVNDTITFTYRISDGTYTSAAATVTITVTGTNDAPVAAPVDLGAIDEDSGARVITSAELLLAGVSDVDGPAATITSLTKTAGLGTLVANPDGISWTYTPALNDDTAVTFAYTAFDGEFNASSTASLDITPVNDAPVANPDTVDETGAPLTTGENASVTTDVIDNDTDVDATDVLSLVAGSAAITSIIFPDGTVNPAASANVSQSGNEITFDPGTDFDFLAPGETATAVIGYTVTDDAAAPLTDEGTLTITVTGENDRPVVADVAIAALEDGPLVSGNFVVSDADTTDTHTFMFTGRILLGLANNDDGTFTFDPATAGGKAVPQSLAEGETADVMVTYTATDNSGTANDTSTEATVTITMTGTNDAPTVSNVVAMATEDGLVVSGSFAGDDEDSDDDQSSLFYTITSEPSEGSASVNAVDPTMFDFDPGSDFQDLADGETRDVTFEYTATDSHTDTSTAATVTVTVTGENDRPVVADVAIAALEDGPSVPGNFVVSDADTTDTHTFTLTSTPSEGSVTDNKDGTFTFDPGTDFQDLAANETRDVTFTYTATDDSGTANDTSTAATVTVTVTGMDDVPVVAIGDTRTTGEDSTLTIDVLANDSGDTLSITEVSGQDITTGSVTLVSGATVTLASGQLVYDPTASASLQGLATGQSKTDTFTYTIVGGSGVADTATVNVAVKGADDPLDNLQASLALSQIVVFRGVLPSPGGGDTAGIPIGSIRTFAGNFDPAGSGYANGQLVSISGNEALFDVLGTTYGGDGINNFALPDLGATTIIGTGQGPGLANFSLGNQTGLSEVTLTAERLPLELGGISEPFDNYQPSLPLNYLITTAENSALGSVDILGQVTPFTGTFAPAGFMLAEGQLLSISGNQALFDVLGTTYGGDGMNNFALPDLRGHTIVGTGNGVQLGDRVGQGLVALSNDQMPVSLGGIGLPFDNQQPSLALNYLIAVQGSFPSQGGPSIGTLLGNEAFLGEVIAFAGDVAPAGWALADGQLLRIGQNAALFSLLGIQYGGDGRDFFALPDLRNQVIVGGEGSQVGDQFGANDISLDISNFPFVAPVILGGDLATVFYVEQQTVPVTDIEAFDANGDIEGAGLSYEIVNQAPGQDGALFSIDADTGVLTFNTPPDFGTPADDDTDNVYSVTVRVTNSDGVDDEQTIAITVGKEDNGPLQTFGDPTPSTEDQFGLAVAIDGNHVLVGDHRDDTDGTTNAGQAHLFDVSTGTVQTFTDPIPGTGDRFGFAVAIDGNHVLVGDPFDDFISEGGAEGRAHLFDVSTGAVQTFNDPTPGTNTSGPLIGDGFGSSVAIDGNLVLIGEGNGVEAHLFDATTGTLLQTFAPGVGAAVALDGNNVLIGAEFGGPQAHLFDTSGTLLATFTDPNTDSFTDRFGNAVAIDGNLVLIGDYTDSTGASNAGQAYLFDATTGTLLQTFNAPTPEVFGLFGVSVAIEGDLVLVGESAGHAHLFDAATGTWLQTIDDPTPGVDDGFGFGVSVAIDGDNVIIGDFLDDTSGTDEGQAHLFDVSGLLVV